MRFDINRYWYRDSLTLLTFLLLPLSVLFGWCAGLRRLFYRFKLWKTHSFSVPIIVVGNLTVGGTGKTPFVIWLAQFLQAQGFRPGIVSRGIGSQRRLHPHWVSLENKASEVGDEAILLRQRSNCPVVIGIDRVAAVAELLKHSDCNIVISDDGLQHYRLERDVEIAIVDNLRRFGNLRLLPAGPLRESVSRLNAMDFVVVNGGSEQDEFVMHLEPLHLVSLQDTQKIISLAEFPHKKVHAVAGIGHPQRFFSTLNHAGFDLITHTYPDHYQYKPYDIDFTDALAVVMTEKDAVKCFSFAKEGYWYLRIAAKMNERLEQKLLTKLETLGVKYD